MTKVVYIIADINKALAFEWIVDHIDATRFSLTFILLNSEESYLKKYLESKQIPVYIIKCKGKKWWPLAIIRMYRLLRTIRPDVIHCHLVDANIVGLISGKMAGVKKRLYTRHHSSFHHFFAPKGVWLDKLSNKLATRIIAISSVVKDILLHWEHVPKGKVTLIAHGFDLTYFKHVEEERIIAFTKKYSLERSNPVIGVISRFEEWKGIQFIVPAFKKLLAYYPNATLLLLNAKGPYEGEIIRLLSDIDSKNYRLIPFENDIAAAYKTFDIFIHVPINNHYEAYGQIYVEALAANVPSIFTKSGIANDFVLDGENALVVPYKDATAIWEKMMLILADESLRSRLVRNGEESIKPKYELTTMIQALEYIYEK